MKTRSIILLLTITLLCLSCRGNTPELGHVEGIVSLDGQPLIGAFVIFEPKASGRASKATTDASGHYQLVYIRDINGALIGTHIVKISTASEDNPKERIPARYNKQSTLTADVVSGANEFNFSLTSK